MLFRGVQIRIALAARILLERVLALDRSPVFLLIVMKNGRNSLRSWLGASLVSLIAAGGGCYVGYKTYTEHYAAADTALGEEHIVDYPLADALELTEDALRGDGILFEVQPDNSIVTNWRPADTNTSTGWFPMIIGEHPRYRYEIQAVPQNARRTKIIVNVRTEGIPDQELARYKASNRFALFNEIDEVAAKYPPKSKLPSSGGVNFTLLPNEDLKALARRVTGRADNWRQIASDNGLTSESDVTPFESIWVRNSLLKPVP
jgi:hypothetical protein